MGDVSIYDQLQNSLLDSGVRPSALPSTLHDILSVITDESGGNPYAINDNTAGKSYQFSSYDEAAQYITDNPDHTMAVGLFQLLLNGGMGDQYRWTPTELLYPNEQFRIALPTLIQNTEKASAYAEGTPEHFKAVVGNPWLADLPAYGGPGEPPDSSVDQTAATLQNLQTGSAFHLTGGVNRVMGSAKDKISSATDFLKNLWSINTVFVIGGSLGIVLILVNMAKGGKD